LPHPARLCYRSAHESAPSGRSQRAGARAARKAISYQFTLGENALRKKDKLTGHLWLEMLDPGSYYKAQDEEAYFARWQLQYAF